jgi:hypothetical protein
MGSLAGVKPGDRIMVLKRGFGATAHTVARVGAVWVTDETGRRFRIDDGYSDVRLEGCRASTMADYEAVQSRARVQTILQDWGLWGQFHGLTEHSLTDEQKLLVALVAVSFEGADALALELAKLNDETLDLVIAKAEQVFRAAAWLRADRGHR